MEHSQSSSDVMTLANDEEGEGLPLPVLELWLYTRRNHGVVEAPGPLVQDCWDEEKSTRPHIRTLLARTYSLATDRLWSAVAICSKVLWVSLKTECLPRMRPKNGKDATVWMSPRICEDPVASCWPCLGAAAVEEEGASEACESRRRA